MEVILTVRNFSYYTSSESAFIHGTVLVKKPIETDSKHSTAFETVEKGSKIGFKFPCSEDKLTKIALLATESILKIKSKEIVPAEPTRFNQFGITYIADEIVKCEI